jgi:hypothetical protein
VPKEEPVPKPEEEVPLPESKEEQAYPSSLPSKRAFEKQTREVSSEAKLPEKEEEDALPLPTEEEKEDIPVPTPDDYLDAKQQLRHKLEQEEIKQELKEESEEMLEQYAKENIVWLYEIYKIGALSREDFLERVREEMHGKKEEEIEPPSNPALESLNRELEKKEKK